jgi:hypothetical protein
MMIRKLLTVEHGKRGKKIGKRKKNVFGRKKNVFGEVAAPEKKKKYLSLRSHFRKEVQGNRSEEHSYRKSSET